jgi:glyoxylase-like metal-dependent hydrolase (beta-lactamase superfamily II)
MSEVAPRIRRVGSDLVNSYLLEDGAEIVIVDAGAPSYWRELPAELAAMGRSFDDVRALVLTHGHDDHKGFAEQARRAGVPVRVHEHDAALARGDVPNRFSIAGPIRPIPTIRFLAYFARHGLLRTPKILEVATFGSGTTLDVPGAPQVTHVPGHTPGSVALLFPQHDALLVGDALNTLSVLSGRTGPQLSPFNADRSLALESLGALEGLSATNVLPGHGAPWHGGVATAVAAVRASEVARLVRA